MSPSGSCAAVTGLFAKCPIRSSEPWAGMSKFFLRAHAPINFEEILSRAHGSFEEQNQVFESSRIIINYCIIIINAYYNCSV